MGVSTGIALRRRRTPSRGLPTRSGLRADLLVVGLASAFLAATVAVGVVLHAQDVPVLAASAPFLAYWGPHAGWGTPLAALVAVAVVLFGPLLAGKMPWGRLLCLAYVTAGVWATGLAFSRGTRGLVGPPSRHEDYLTDVPSAPPLPELLTTFTERIPFSHPDNWITHVAGHPPAAFLVFVGLDDAGLGGPAWAAVVCVLAGAAAVPAVALAVRGLAGESWARRALPFLVLFPGAVWVAVSADALFLGVTAWGLALLVLATRANGFGHDMVALCAGLLLGVGLFLSYGLILLGLPALAVLFWARRLRTLLVAGAAVVAVVAAFAAAGFVWWDGYQALVPRYYDGWGGQRPYAYWVWANLAMMLAVVGPASYAGIRRVMGGVGRVPPGLVLIVAGMGVVLVAATLSGLSKAEVERIWLPFTAWLVVACATLPARHHRGWLASQAVVALLVEHLMLSSW
jgi:methylthioxylose transferase